MASVEERTGVLNGLLQGELSAVETYEQALKKFENQPELPELRRIEGEHREAVNQLRRVVVERGGRPVSSSGVWGIWATAVQGAAQLLGTAAALKALKEGEEHGVSNYESAVKNEGLDPDSRTLISATLLPQTQGHIRDLDALLNGAK